MIVLAHAQTHCATNTDTSPNKPASTGFIGHDALQVDFEVDHHMPHMSHMYIDTSMMGHDGASVTQLPVRISTYRPVYLVTGSTSPAAATSSTRVLSMPKFCSFPLWSHTVAQVLVRQGRHSHCGTANMERGACEQAVTLCTPT